VVRRFLLLASTLLVAVIAGSPAVAGAAAPKPVPSLTPAKTATLWRQLVKRPRAFHQVDCGTPLRAVFYAGTDWLRLATRLAANASPCAQYFISVPPLVADKAQFRADQAWRIRALGPQFHVLAEVNVSGWSNWVATSGSTWHAAGQEARRRMAAAGYDVGLGDSWVVNEFSSAVRQGVGSARANMRSFIRGLYEGDGSVPVARGAVFVTGMGQATGELSVYQSRLQDWYEDAPFWEDMSAYVSDWSQELYGDVRNWAVAGADPVTRAAALSDYLQHEVALARAAPAAAAAAGSFLSAAYNPLANAAWAYTAAFGWTDVPFELMQSYVSSQASALRSYNSSRFGFAWSPKNANALPSADFSAQTEAILDRLAVAIASTDACAPTWCGGDLSGSAFNTGWQTFATWKPSLLAFTTESQTIAAGSPSVPLTVEQRTNTGVVYTAGVPVPVTFASSSAGGAFSTSPSGPWAPTLTVAIASATSAASVYYSDTQTGTPTITASAPSRAATTQLATIGPPADTTPPETTIDAAPSGLVASASASLSFSSEPGARFECAVDGGAFAECSSPASHSALAQGPHTFDVRAVDVAGNHDPSPARAAWTVDTVAPETSFTHWSRPASRAATLWFTADESATFACSLDGGTWSLCDSPKTYTGLMRGWHTISARATDPAGNVDPSPATQSVKI
jgi:hypothetical protein